MIISPSTSLLLLLARDVHRMSGNGRRLLHYSTLSNGFGVIRFASPVSLTELRIIPSGARIFAQSDVLVGSTTAAETAFNVTAYLHQPPVTVGTFSKPASVLPILLEYDPGEEAETSSFLLDLPASLKSRLLVLQGDFESLTIAVYGYTAEPQLSVNPSPVPTLSPAPAARQPSPPRPIGPPKPDLEAIQRLLKQKPLSRAPEVDIFSDVDLQLPLSLFGDREGMSAAISKALEPADSIQDGMDTDLPHLSWADVADWSENRVGKMTPRELEAVVASVETQDWMLDDDRPAWITVRRLSAAIQKLARSSEQFATALLTADFLERSMILACEPSAHASRLAFLSETLLVAAHYPALFLSLTSLPSYASFIALASPAREILLKRRELVDLLSSPLTDQDDIYSLADCAVPSIAFPVEALIRYLRHFGFLSALEPVLIDVPASDIAEPILHVLISLVVTHAGRLYLAQHLEEPGVILASMLRDFAAESSVEEALIALRQWRRGQAVEMAPHLAKIMVALISTAATASGLGQDGDMALAACAALGSLLSEGSCASIVTCILASKETFSALLQLRQGDIPTRTAQNLLKAVLADPLLLVRPQTVLDVFGDLDLSKLPPGMRADVEDLRVFAVLSRDGQHPCAALAHALATLSRHDLALQEIAAHRLAICINAVAASGGRDELLRLWAVVGTATLQHELLACLQNALKAFDRLDGLAYEREWIEAINLASNTSRSAKIRKALLEVLEATTHLLTHLGLDGLTAPHTRTLVRTYALSWSVASGSDAEQGAIARLTMSHCQLLLAKVEASMLLKAMEQLWRQQPARTPAISQLLRSLLPKPPHAGWTRAAAGHADFLVSLSDAPLLEQMVSLDANKRVVGLSAIFDDVKAEHASRQAITMEALLALVPKEELVPDGASAEAAGFSVKAYKGDAFRLQASEKILARPPSMHVDHFQSTPSAAA